jgi:Asp-tRNA(Asn)/Glu-tRNA(Gln) amidotransferase A subunit family amidase
MARRVRDLRLAYGVICGPDPRDPLWTPAPLHGPAPDRPVRVAVVRDPGGVGVDADVAAGVKAAVDALADAGYDVADAEPPVMDAYRSWRTGEEVRAITDSMRLTVAANKPGLPAVAVPVGVASGLPLGVQVIGPRYREDLCLEAAEAIEARLGVITPIDHAVAGRSPPMTIALRGSGGSGATPSRAVTPEWCRCSGSSHTPAAAV